MRDHRPQAEKPRHEKALRGARPAWEIVCDNYTGYATYQRRAGDRVIPVVALTPGEGRPVAGYCS